MNPFLPTLALPALLGTLGFLFVGSEPEAPQVRLAVAANFLEPMETLVDRFERKTGHRVATSSGSTGKLYAQIVHGAPYDLFLAANDREPLRLEREGYAVPRSRFTYALGVLVLWLPGGGGGPATDARTAFDMVRPHRVAIANPRVAPYGAAAASVLESWGALNERSRKILRGESVAQAYQFTVSGNAGAGFVSLSQIVASPRRLHGRHWRVDHALHPPIRQQVVLLKHGANNPVALAFMQYLQSTEARNTIASYGYGLE